MIHEILVLVTHSPSPKTSFATALDRDGVLVFYAIGK